MPIEENVLANIQLGITLLDAYTVISVAEPIKIFVFNLKIQGFNNPYCNFDCGL